MRPLIIAHRGAPSYLPEHTESSYRLAVRQGADLVEPDVVPTRDGVLIVRHEARLESTTNIAEHPQFAGRRRGDSLTEDAPGEHVGWFAEDFVWAEIQQLRATERIPDLRPASAAHSGAEPVLRLRELVTIIHDEARARGRYCGLVIELKHDARTLAFGFDHVDLLARELEGLWHLDVLRDLRIESFEAAALDRLRERGSTAKHVVLVAAAEEVGPGEEGPARLTAEGLDDAAERFDGISVRTSLLSRELVEAAKARGLEVLTYTLRAEDEFLPAEYAGRPEAYWEVLLDTGVDGVFADAPDRLVELRDRRQSAVVLRAATR
ncbi:MAG: glycerophosphodiester phosphodiesterase family protein [Gulosibacter sp.]|uniref:glycerophosphodiester phosphodiesterase family protein n=1 Tax=Gulosibacter sp. TaxID=2817531 RepID=UPI003F90FA98